MQDQPQDAASRFAAVATERLWLRPWKEADLPAFAALNADPRVMEFLPKVLSRAESDARAAQIVEHFHEHGFGLWAVEVKAGAGFIGFVGLNVPAFEAHFTPCVEVGWRLACEHWGRGYATEAARAALAFGFDTLGLSEIVALTVPANERSRRVMERLGMTRSPADDFEHPNLPSGHPLRPHVLYRLARSGTTFAISTPSHS
jgi:RimJ/RimL family protein N-acetyltransferase